MNADREVTLDSVKDVVRGLADAALCISEDGIIAEANETAALLLESRREDLLGAPYRGAFVVSGLSFDGAEEDQVAMLIAAGGGHAPVGSTLRLRGGRTLFADCSVSSFKLGEAPEKRCALFIVRPFTAFQQRAHMAIQASEGKWLALVENTQAAIYVKDIGGPFRYVNKAFCAVFGLAREDVVRKTEFEALPPQAAELFRLRELDVAYADGTVTAEDELLLEGKVRHFVASRFPLTQAPDRPAALCCIATDVTSLRSMENAIRLHRDELARFSRLSIAGEMASGIAHELNQPLSAALSLAEAAGNLLEDDEPDALARARSLMREAVGQIVRTGDIVHNLRAFMQRGEAQKLTRIDLNVVARKSSTLLSRELDEAGVELRLALSPSPMIVTGAQLQIEQVAVNLLRNALDAVRAMTGQDRVIDVVTMSAEGKGSLAVRDNGRGIDPALADRLFEPFFTTREKGMGLGLAICRSTIERLGGAIEVEPGRQAGFGIRFSLPLAPPRDQ